MRIMLYFQVNYRSIVSGLNCSDLLRTSIRNIKIMHVIDAISGLILGLHYKVTPSLIGWVQT